MVQMLLVAKKRVDWDLHAGRSEWVILNRLTLKSRGRSISQIVNLSLQTIETKQLISSIFHVCLACEWMPAESFLTEEEPLVATHEVHLRLSSSIRDPLKAERISKASRTAGMSSNHRRLRVVNYW